MQPQRLADLLTKGAAVLLAVAMAATLGGCALLPRMPPPPLPLLPLAAQERTGVFTQVLHIAHGKHEMTLQCVLKAETDVDTLIALGPFGQRLFTLRYDAEGLHAKTSPYLPQNLPSRRIWADVELALWPLSAWRQHLAGTGWALSEPQSGVRRLRYGDRLVAEVHYDKASDGWTGRFWLVDFVYDYTLDITSSPVEPASTLTNEAAAKAP